jgi:hypothetical protein
MTSDDRAAVLALIDADGLPGQQPAHETLAPASMGLREAETRRVG